MTYPVHTKATAPERARPLLAQVERAFGFLPNLAGMLAEAPPVLEGYLGVAGAFAKSSLTPAEQQVVLLASSVENECHYCVAAHSTIALGAGLDRDAVDALRSGTPLADSRLEALRRYTRDVVARRGWTADSLPAFLAAGFSRAQALEVILGVAQKTISNYANHLAATPVDEPFQGEVWEASAR
ncbi:MAG: carboxymuconolactone decarboxylase family protein [Gemmatimonadales bacterium]